MDGEGAVERGAQARALELAPSDLEGENMVVGTGKTGRCMRCGTSFSIGCVITPLCGTCRAAKVWELKTWPIFYEALYDGRKTFDVRNGEDRDYKARLTG